MRVQQYAEDALTVTLGQNIDETINTQLVQLKEKFVELDFEGVLDIVISYTSLIIYFDVLRADVKAMKSALEEMKQEELSTTPSSYKVVEIPVCYGGEFGPDIKKFEKSGLSETDVIELHSNKEYLVYMLGFMPGFPYLGGLDERLYKDRLDSPRTRIPAGSVGIGGQQTGMYPFTSPGGWNLLGRTPIPLYDKNRDHAILYGAGDRIVYKAIDEDEYYRLEQAYYDGAYEVKVIDDRGEANDD
ncbi:5-oxoprolinase subunit PxpB [Jeotgalicoccus sp. ATCC 8456]|uniref:5-oxoprolinase subunit PxpB n=1 Tax=Jeotgalicoccus sp. ATCC 8456 TaxID=946435 RepID=UPI0018E5BC7E|nr:5-oxoprolinase subunit PxpB [Jeotgalicoccus sp. ATCC 8456]QQD84981.1 5-oxoprolinase subunit PxpB [Jeotgalicoccus sp. ATCC 8456]